MRSFRVLAVAAGLIASVLALTASPGGARPTSANATGRYIVVLDAAVDPAAVADEHRRSDGAQVTHVYRTVLNGYAASMSSAAAARISRDPRVSYVEVDQQVQAVDGHLGEVPFGLDRAGLPDGVGLPSHLQLVDDKRVDVDVAVIDTGIDHTHSDLVVVGGADCTGGGPFGSSCSDGLPGDGNGHGTHVAGTIGARANGAGVVGVAPGARLHAVKVLRSDGSGYMSWITAGVEWVTAKGIKVANMSLGCECTSSALNTAITNSVDAGVVHAVAAGNSAKDASTFSPANHPDVITVSALADFNGLSGGNAPATCRTDEDDTLASFSNYGNFVEVAAPGVCIRSTWPKGGYNTISGTSMASPHVAGAAALLVSNTKPRDKPGALSVRSTIVAKGNSGWTDDSGDGTPEPLLDVTDVVFAPKLVETTSGSNLSATLKKDSCTNTTCSFTGTGQGTGTLSWSMDFGDGSSATGSGSAPLAVTRDRTYSKKGTFTVTFTVRDGAGGIKSATETVSCTGKGSKPSACS